MSDFISSSDIALFSLKRVDERYWSHVRGMALLGDVFDGSACAMDTTAAHIAAVCALPQAATPQGNFALFCFDAVPPNAHCSEDAIVQAKTLLVCF